MVFGHFGAPGLPWGPPWRPNLDFCEFGSIFGGFLSRLPPTPPACARRLFFLSLQYTQPARGVCPQECSARARAREGIVPEARAHAGRRKEGEGRLSGEGAHLIGFDGTTVGSTIVPMMMLVI